MTLTEKHLDADTDVANDAYKHSGRNKARERECRQRSVTKRVGCEFSRVEHRGARRRIVVFSENAHNDLR